MKQHKAIELVLAALTPAMQLIVARLVDLAMDATVKSGISPAGLHFTDFMAIGGRLRIGALAAMRFFDYVPLAGGYSQAATIFTKAHRAPAEIAMAMKVGVGFNAFLLDVRHFTPYFEMLGQAISSQEEDLSFSPVKQLEPCSEGAIRWAQELGSPLHYTSLISTPQSDALKNVPDKEAFKIIKEKEMISEPEMALLLSISAKSLGNRRRANEVNRSLYIQKKRNARAWYHRGKALAALQNGTFFVTPNPGKR